MTQTKLAVWRDNLLTDWAHVKETLVNQLHACHQDRWAKQIALCEHDQLLDLISQWDLPTVTQAMARLKRIDAALCQMDLGLYGLCADCEEPLSDAQLAQDPTAQRCPHCDARYRKGFHGHEL
ncbi:TraR/DksA family transcriptional regulator [Aeromonas cavernicola]|uniref:Conjugal transfer protein TraR n=1 Tax=Aeromonas cavernicola TaxID=1006623 RepID=A0A2H9U3N2_9GAMM|nr:conjugal transfer protein TraR [Aeromonas cavernicola]PJG58657.1 conjugal transfer protein TraR [Aeromonas cavernicola]